jgi:citronellol/citronellal dehydrogenase
LAWPLPQRAARDGANIVILAKTTDPNPKLPGTIYSAAKEIEAAGGRALPLAVDIRDDAAVFRRLPKRWRLLAASTFWSTTPAPSA